jgi:calcium-dependent protein kinase
MGCGSPDAGATKVAPDPVVPETKNGFEKKKVDNSRGSCEEVTSLVKKHEKEDEAKGRVNQQRGTTFVRSQLIKSSGANIGESYEAVGQKNSELGQGSYGTVRQWKHKTGGYIRAVKTIRKKSVDIDRLAAEIEIMKLLDHPNVIKLYETFEDNRNIYLVMEMCKGGELFDRIVDAGSFNEKDAATVAKQALSALYYMHSSHVAHRDLKPENFLLSVKGEAIKDTPLKIIDFGLSRRFTPGEKMTTRACTPYYVAPEILGKNGYSESCDLWSMGVIIFVLLSGSPPFYGDNDREVLKSVQKGKYFFNPSAWSAISMDAMDLIQHLLVLEPEKRFSAEKALAHTWIERLAPNSKGAVLDTAAIASLRSWHKHSQMKRIALTMIAQQMDDDSIKELKELFFALDVDGDGTLTIEEITAGLDKQGGKAIADQKEEILESMRDMDPECTGHVNYTEFLAATLSKRIALQEDQCWAAFRFFDLNGDGKITKEELSKAFTAGGGMSADDADIVGPGLADLVTQTMQEADKNGDGEIDFDEFCAMMNAKRKVTVDEVKVKKKKTKGE